MPSRRTVSARVVLLVSQSLLLCATPAAAQVAVDVTGRIDLGAGHDNNIYLDAYPLPLDKPAAEGGLVEIIPDLSLVLGRRQSHHLELRYGAILRQLLSSGNETVLTHGGGLGYSTAPFGGFRLRLTGRFDQLHLRMDDTGWLGGGWGLILERALGYSLRGALTYEGHFSSYDAQTGVSWELAHRFGLNLAWRVAPGLVLAPEYLLSLVRAEPDALDRLEHHPGLALCWDLPWIPLDIAAGYGLVVFTLDQPGAGGTELMHRVTAKLDLHLISWLDIFVRADLSLGDQDYSRRQVLGGLALHWSWSRDRPKREAPRRGVLRVRHSAPDARTVAVVGTFNGWDPTVHRLRRSGKGWEGEIPLPPGSHQYMLWVDGKIRPPEECQRWVADGFGGTSCIIDGGP